MAVEFKNNRDRLFKDKYLGVRKCKRIVKVLFPHLCMYLMSYMRFNSFEMLSCYKGRWDLSFRFAYDRYDNIMIYLSIFDTESLGSDYEYWLRLDSNFNVIGESREFAYSGLSEMFN